MTRLPPAPAPHPITRRRFLQRAGGAAAVAALPALGACGGSDDLSDADAARRDLDAKIAEAMQRYRIPGVAVGVWHAGQAWLKGYGVTNVDSPRPVDADTLFRIGSNSKPLCGTAAAVLIDRGRVDLDRGIDHYVPDFVAPAGAEGVTVRQVLNHTCGWLGYDYHDTGRGDDALAQYVRDVRRLPQLTPPGQTFGYNNAGISVAGRVIECVTGGSYEDAVRSLVLDPLGMSATTFYTDEIIGLNIAAPHDVGPDGEPVVAPALWALPRSMNPFGGAISSVRDMLTFARFHLGDGSAGGRRVMSAATLQSMRSHPGAGGTLLVELDGAGISWMIRPSAEGPKVIHHGGDVPAYHSGLMLVPERDFAITLLTNSENGPKLVEELFFDDWALARFAGLHNLPAVPQALDAAALAAYAGRYGAQQIPFDGATVELPLTLAAHQGGLLAALGPEGAQAQQLLRFYAPDFVLVDPVEGPPLYARANFVRGADGAVAWFRLGGRLFRREA